MRRAVLIALAGSTALIAGAAQAQQICCAPAPPPPPPGGMRGYAQPQYAQPEYAPPQYDPRPLDSGLRGYVGVEYGKARLNPGTPSPRVESWTAEGAVSGYIGGWGVQGDVKIANYSQLGAGSDETAVAPTVHLYRRGAHGLVGGWAGWSHTGNADLFGLGLEGQTNLGGVTLYGSLGYGHVNDTIDQNLWAARLEGRYFVTENFMINATGGLVRASGNGARTTVRSIGLGAEYQPSALPISLQAGYAHYDASNSSAESDLIRIGLRWNFQGATLAERNALGPSLNNVSDLFSAN